MTNTIKFVPVGGPNYSTDLESDGFDTLEEAAQEWARRRNCITGQFPCWGDGAAYGEESGAGSTAVIEVGGWTDDDGRFEPGDVHAAWTVAELEPLIGESAHYFEPGDDDEPETLIRPTVPETLSYVPFAVTDDGEVLCTGCVRDESNPVHVGGPADGWRVDGWDHSGTVESTDAVVCAHCGRVIVAADDEQDDDDEPGTACIHHPGTTATHSNIGRLVDIHRDAVWHYCQPCADRFLTDQGKSTYRLVEPTWGPGSTWGTVTPENYWGATSAVVPDRLV